MDENLLVYSSQLKRLLEKSEKVTKCSIQSINRLEKLVDNIKETSPAIDYFEKQRLISSNLTQAAFDLEQFIRLANCINNDEFLIKLGSQGLVSDYIRKLNFLKTISKYTDVPKVSSFLKLTTDNLNKLLNQADSHLSLEFQAIINQYSGESQIELFIDFLINVSSEELFIPNGALAKLEEITSWLVKRENEYELHGDLNEKLKFSEIRNCFLQRLMQSCSKMSSFDLYKSKLKSKLYSFKTHSESQKAVEYISLFAENLNVFLKMVKHENNLINRIYLNADENTRADLISKLTIVMIKNLQVEFEKFFVNSFDFRKLCYNGDQVLREIINLNAKVYILREDTIQKSEDLQAASQFLAFTIKLNELTATILKNYQIIIKNGYFNSDVINPNLRVHSFCVQTLQSIRIINMNKYCISETISQSLKENPKNETDNISLNENFSSNQMVNTDDYNFKVYFSNLIRNLWVFLLHEVQHHVDSHRFYCINSKFKTLLDVFKKSIFLINNFDFIQDFLNELKIHLTESFNINDLINDASKLFSFMSLKISRHTQSVENKTLTKERNSTENDDKLESQKPSLNKKKQVELINNWIEIIQVCKKIVITNLKAKEMIKNYLRMSLDKTLGILNESEIDLLRSQLNIKKTENLILEIYNKLF